ncbi:MAG: PhzF family phenazine biosynthesis protein [Vitreimonas sp.]
MDGSLYVSMRFAVYDVFTDTPYAGNPLAVVFDADALSDALMQAIAREFNLSETVFIRSAVKTRRAAAIRIFTPTKELPFAGHPTIGAAIALAESEYGRSEAKDMVFVLDASIGPVRCGVKIAPDGATFAEFAAPRLAQQVARDPSLASVARAIGLTPEDMGFNAHRPSVFSVGVSFVMIPVVNADALARAKPCDDLRSLELGATEIFVYTRAEREAPYSFRARMFAPEIGIAEDPATGGAAAAFAGVLARFEDLPEGWHTLPILQGVEMGRPSLIGLDVHIENGALAGARIAGKAVKVSEGVLYL